MRPPDAALAALRRGDRRTLARLLTRVESGDPDARAAAFAEPWPEDCRVVAATGPPGVGKSALLAAAAERWLADGVKTAVLAVDPTSPATGGAVLGDRTRLASDEGAVFWRSMAARDADAGLAPQVEPALRLMAAAGFRRVLLETAGVGQGDVRAAGLADLTLAVTAPGLGDSVQAAKAGLFEIAELVVVNQGDRPGAEAHAASWRSMRSGPVLVTTATTGAGVRELVAEAERALAARPGKPRVGRPIALRLHHVGIATPDSSEGAALWESLLGLEEREFHEVPEFSVVARFVAPDGGGAQLELVEPTDPESPVRRFLERRGAGLHHVCFEVADIERTMAALRERGARFLDERPRPGAGGRLVAFVHPKSAGGALLELRQA